MNRITKYMLEYEEDSGEVVVYSMLTTSLVRLSKKVYREIFENLNFNADIETVEKLKKCGFIHDEQFDELKYLEQLRAKSMEKLNNMRTPYFMITPTMDCNARCYYCFENGSHKEKMPLNIADRVVDFILKERQTDDVVLQWFGGEPLMAQDVIEHISGRLKHNGINITSKLTTNGYYLNEAVLDRAINSWGVDVIQITIDALHDEYNRIKNYKDRDTESAFERVIRNIFSAIGRGLKVRIRINYNPLEHDEADETIAYLRSFFSEYDNVYVYFAPIDSENIPSVSETFESKTKHPLLDLIDRNSGFAGMAQLTRGEMDNRRSILSKYYLHPIPLSCTGVCSRNLTIDSKGDIYICHRLLGRESQYSSGNVTTGVIDNKVTKQYRSIELSYEECYECKFLPVCQGGCKFRADEYSQMKACTPIKSISVEVLKRAISEIEMLKD